MASDHQSPHAPRGKDAGPKGPGPTDATAKSPGTSGKRDKVPGALARPAEALPSALGTPPVKPHKYVGVAQPLIDGVDKVTGRAKYSADLPFPDALVGRILRSPHAHANIKRLDASKALALPGVRAVVTGEDSDVPFGILPIAKDEYALARGKVRYKGEEVAAVAAVDAWTAEQALALIEVEYEPLPS